MLGECLTAQQRYAEAEPLLLESYPVLKAKLGEQHARTVDALRRLVALYEAWGQPDKASDYRAMLIE